MKMSRSLCILFSCVFYQNAMGQFSPYGMPGGAMQRTPGGAMQLMSDCEKVPSMQMCNNAVDKAGRHCSWDTEGIKCNEFGSSDWHPMGWHPTMPGMGFASPSPYGGASSSPYGGASSSPYGGGRPEPMWNAGSSFRPSGSGDSGFFDASADKAPPSSSSPDSGADSTPAGVSPPNDISTAPERPPAPPTRPQTPQHPPRRAPQHLLFTDCESVYDVGTCNTAIDKEGRHCSWFYNEMKCNSFFESDYGGGWFPTARQQNPSMPYGPFGGGRPSGMQFPPPSAPGPNPNCPEYRLTNKNWAQDWKVHEPLQKSVAEETAGPKFLAHIAVACSRFEVDECRTQVACAWKENSNSCGPFLEVATKVSAQGSKSTVLKSVHKASRAKPQSTHFFGGVGFAFLAVFFLMLGLLAGRASKNSTQRSNLLLQDVRLPTP